MNNWRQKCVIILFLLLFSNVAMAKASETPSDTALPKVSFFYAALFDHVCEINTNYKIDASWVNELNQQMPNWQALWNSEGTVLMRKTVTLIGRPFSQKDFQVALSLCSFPSMSAPLIVNTRFALHHFINNPIPDYVVISNIYHEILHNYIDSFLPQNTPLLNKYKNETSMVRNHLHLFALEKAIYLQLGWKSKLKAIIAKDESLPSKDYQRAWKIINEKENYLDFIVELQKFKHNKTIYSSSI